jgi:hypothetical protein
MEPEVFINMAQECVIGAYPERESIHIFIPYSFNIDLNIFLPFTLQFSHWSLSLDSYHKLVLV